MDFNSLCVKDVKDPRTTKSHILPIYPTASFEFDTIQEGISIFSGERSGHVYSRYGNPTIEAVAGKIAAMETFELDIEAKAILFSSGMSAISSLLMAICNSGDAILTQGNLYGGTTELLLKMFKPLGVKVIFTDLKDLEGTENILKENKQISIILFETPANPTHACVDIKALCNLATRYQVKSVIDNTLATPYLQQPFAFGVDFIIHSSTKYLNGHGNSLSGVVVGKDIAFMEEKVWPVMKLMGTNSNPWDAWLLHQGMKTLTLRMDRHSDNALEIAQFLEDRFEVEKVNYCGLTSHPDHVTASAQMKKFGGLLSFELKGGLASGKRFMNNIGFCTFAPTLGDVDTLILHPASSSHLNVDKALRLENGITDGLIRLSVGIESSKDIIRDLLQALD